MGDLAFGQSFKMLTDGVKHPFIALVESHMAMAGTFSQLIWMFPLFRAMPFLGREDAIFQKWLETQVRHQEQDACLQLQEEIDNLFSSSSHPNHSSFAKLPYFQACIDETLRLFPPVPSGLQRMTPAEGLRVGDIFIPGDTIVTVPSYTLYRDERYFTAPDDFIPERWTTRPEMIKDDSVFAPFSVGRYACVGKQLGLMEVGYATCMILHHFDICLCGGGTTSKLAFLGGLRDHFTLNAPPLNVVLTARKH
ncbi:hypothetical protein LB503_013321 [Fusarium chuoi]|nr:hypothetical protein LB503_013321 [Fusarium chuoi]